MADLADVENALVELIAGIIYPNGATVSPSGPPTSILGTTIVSVFRGWPIPDNLARDLKAGRCDVSVYSIPGGSRNVSRYSREWVSVPGGNATLTATVSGNTATYGGTVAVGQIANLTADGIGFSYAPLADDTLIIVAAALVGAINSDGQLTATFNGSTVTVTSATGLPVPVTASGSSTGTAWRETRRQEQRLVISVWCPTPALRDDLAGAVDNGLSDIDWLNVGDPISARIRYTSTSEQDGATNAGLYRRDITLTVEYPTIQTVIAAPLIVPVGLLHVAGTLNVFATAQPGAGIAEDPNGNILVDAGGTPLAPILQPDPNVETDASGAAITDTEGNLAGSST